MAFALVLALAVAVSYSQPAVADVPPIPDKVTAWFKDRAPFVIAFHSQAAPDEPLASDHVQCPFGSVVGDPTPVMTWDESFLEAKRPSASLLVPRGDWIAPVVSADGAPVGTLTADTMHSVDIGYSLDNDAESASAILDRARGALVMADGPNGVFIITNDTARQVGLDRVGVRSATGTLMDLQAALVEYKTGIDAQRAAAGGEDLVGATPLDFGAYLDAHGPIPMPSTGVPWWVLCVGGGVLVIGVAAFIAIRRRGPRTAV